MSNPDLRNLVRVASQLQEQVRSAVQRLEQSTVTTTPPAETPFPSASAGEQGTSQGRQALTRTPVARINSSPSLSSRSSGATLRQSE